MSRFARPLATIVLIAGTAVPLHAQARRAMTLENLLTAVRVGDPQLSPDGRVVLFTRTTTTMPAGKRLSEIWKVPADGSTAPAAFVQGEKSVRARGFCRTAGASSSSRIAMGRRRCMCRAWTAGRRRQ